MATSSLILIGLVAFVIGALVGYTLETAAQIIKLYRISRLEERLNIEELDYTALTVELDKAVARGDVEAVQRISCAIKDVISKNGNG